MSTLKHMKRFLSVLFVVSLALSLFSAGAIAKVREGSACSKKNTAAVSGAERLKCVKSGKKLIWKKIKVAPSQKEVGQVSAPWVLTSQGSFDDSAKCEIVNMLESPWHYGFPRPSLSIPTLGDKKAITLFVYFDDLASDPKQMSEWKNNQIPTFERFVKLASYGKLSYKVDTYDTFLHIEKSVLTYNLDTPHSAPPKKNADASSLIKDAVNLADPMIDFSKYEFINVVTAPTTLIGFEGVVAGLRLNVDGKNFDTSSFGPIREYVDDPRKKIWLVHEAGHMMGLAHQFNTVTQGMWDKTGYPIWSAMADGKSAMPEFMAWEKFLLGWLSGPQVQCIETFREPTYTTKVFSLSEQEPNPKATFVKIDATKVLVVESRRNGALGKLSRDEEGALIYIVDSTIKDGQGAFTLLFNKTKRKEGNLLATLNAGESVASNGIKVEILKSESDGDVVRISRTD